MAKNRLTKALILGVNGQDGIFLAKNLLDRKYEVVGVGRQNYARIDFLAPNFIYKQLDLRHANLLFDLLDVVNPDFIFHVAAVHTSAGGSYEGIWNDALQVNIASVHSILEYIRLKNPNGRMIYASSGKVFGEPYPLQVDEFTAIKNNCLYSITKNTAFQLIKYYRDQFFIKASVVYLFNHESEFRSLDYFIPKVLNCLVSARRDPNHVANLNTLDFYCDWGSAEEYMQLMIKIAEVAPNEDFVLATGTATYARELVDIIFHLNGINYKNHIIEKRTKGSSINKPYYVDTNKLKINIGSIPHKSIIDVCEKILSVNK
jgi:GDPmannose 4,6-dehydratase